MPVIRKFKGEPKYNEILNTSVEDLECVYDVKITYNRSFTMLFNETLLSCC